MKKESAKRILVVGVILGLGAITSAVLIATGPRTQPEESQRAPRTVKTLAVSPRTEPISVAAWGTVEPERRVIIRPQVGGRIVKQHEALAPGGFIREGDLLIGIERTDYELAFAQQQAAAEEARFALALEKGQQVVAAREWKVMKEALGEEIEGDPSLALREPHLRRAEALVAQANLRVERARLDLARTRMTAPFNAMVVEEAVEIGQVVEVGAPLCTLVGTDALWVRASLPVADLKWVRVPGPEHPGARATITLDLGGGRNVTWPGHVVRLLGALEGQGRMAQVLVRVDNPMGAEGASGSQLPLLLGSYVRVDIDAGQLEDVLVIPRRALREGDRLWVVSEDNTLEIRPVEVLWRQRETVLVANRVGARERLVVSDLKVALPGMRVSPLPAEEPATAAPSSEGPRGMGLP